MSDADCVAFLQEALPRLGLCWQGFRKVHGQVCKRLRRRMKELGIEGFAAYRKRLDTHPEEWDGARRIDPHHHLALLPRHEHLRSPRAPRSARYCGAREERETASAVLVRRMRLGRRALYAQDPLGSRGGERLSRCGLLGVATDVDETVLKRARKGCYSGGSLRELPEALIRQGFEQADSLFCVRPQHREGVSFLLQDLRSEAPEGLFDLILCRNVAFTYFEAPLQAEALDRLVERLARPGYLVIGAQEKLPHEMIYLIPLPGVPEIFRYETALPEA